MSIRPNPATIRPFSCQRFLPGPGCVSLVISGIYGWLVGAASASIEKYPATTELSTGRRPKVRMSRNPAISGHYPATRFFAWLSQASDRKPLSFKHIRRHQASQIGRVAIYPAMDCVPVNVRKCPQWAANRSYPNAKTNPRIGVCDSLRRWNRWLLTESGVSANVRKSKLLIQIGMNSVAPRVSLAPKH